MREPCWAPRQPARSQITGKRLVDERKHPRLSGEIGARQLRPVGRTERPVGPDEGSYLLRVVEVHLAQAAQIQLIGRRDGSAALTARRSHLRGVAFKEAICR